MANRPRWKAKPKGFATVKGTGQDKGWWVKAGSAGNAPAQTNPYAGLPGWAQTYLKGWDERSSQHQKDIDVNVAPWLKSATEAQTAYATGNQERQAAIMANIQSSIGNAVGNLGPIGTKGQVYSGPNVMQKAGAAGMATLANLGTASQTTGAAANALGVSDLGQGIVSNLATYRAGLPLLYNQQRDERLLDLQKMNWQFKQDHRRFGQEMRQRQREFRTDTRLRQSEIAAQLGWDQERFGREMDLEERKFTEGQRQFDESLEADQAAAAEADKPKGPTEATKRKVRSYIADIKTEIPMAERKYRTRAWMANRIVQDLGISKTWALHIARALGFPKARKAGPSGFDQPEE